MMSVPVSRAETPSNLNPDAAASPKVKQTKICVYCGSASGKNPAHIQAAQELGRLMAENNIKLGMCIFPTFHPPQTLSFLGAYHIGP